ncbi:MAG: hypothetical protein HOG19_11835 [Gammaproteobacteria bacterium]|nr:hypothetical protein [Gammaproteobacteria bacterium]
MFDITRLMQDFGNKETNKLASELTEILAQSKFDIKSPISITNRSSGPVFDIVQKGAEQHRVIAAKDEAGSVVEVGIGAGSIGIVASELLPDPNFALDPTLVNDVFSTQGNVARDSESSLLNEGVSGSGIPHTRKPFVPVAGWGEAFANLQKSADTEHAPESSVKLTRAGNQYWWPTEPWKWQAVRCTITAINNDTLTCNVVANGKVVAESITVAKPCHLQRTPWDGVTYDGAVYAYSNSQTRTSTVGYSATNQEVYPAYDLSSPCPAIYAHWVGNSTNISNVGWIDLNLDARHWIAS